MSRRISCLTSCSNAFSLSGKKDNLEFFFLTDNGINIPQKGVKTTEGNVTGSIVEILTQIADTLAKMPNSY